MRIALLLLLASSASAQTIPGLVKPANAKRFSDIASVETSIAPKAAKPGETVTLTLTVTIEPTCTTYPTGIKQTSVNRILTPDKGPLQSLGLPVDPPGLLSKPGVEPGQIEKYYADSVTWTWTARVNPQATTGPSTLSFDNSMIVACNETSSFNAKKSDIPSVAFEVLPGGPVAVLPDTRPVEPAPKEPEKVATGLKKKAAKDLAAYQADLDGVAASLVKGDALTGTITSSGLMGLLAAAVFWGYVSLITPCVFPMIPITVSLFLKQSHQSTRGAVKFALVYCLTIVLVLGLAAVFLLGVFRELSVSPGMNLVLGLLLVAFALSLFGMYDIQLPNFLLRATEKRRAGGGLIGTVFGALAFSIVSFTCVAPFLGGFAGLAASGNYSRVELILAGLTFAAAFASPFFVLAMFPSLLKKLPRSGGWLDTVKAVMGFLELAAAFKFFRTAELRRPPVEYFTYDIVLGAWIAISLVCGLYLLGFFRLPHDDEKPHLPVPRLLFAMLFLGFGIYLMPGIFKSGDGRAQRPGGVVFAWVDSFLLPDATEDMAWSADLSAALDAARNGKKLVFLDFTGVTCTNCRYNELNVFHQPAVREALQKYELVQLYTDDVPAEFFKMAPSTAYRRAEAEVNTEFQSKAFGTQQLPLYVILQPLPDGKVKVMSIYDEGKINDRDAFAKFVTEPLK